MTRIAVLVAIAISAAGCGRDKPQVTAGQTLSDEELKQKCADQQWREKKSRDLVRRVPAAGGVVVARGRTIRIS